MSDNGVEPYDFINPPKSLEHRITKLEENAWNDAEAQDADDVDAFLRKHVIASWRSIELEHEDAVRRGRSISFEQAVVLDALMRSADVTEDFLAITSQFGREELLKKIAAASEPWLEKYSLRIDYDSEVEYQGAEWEIFIDAKVS